MPPIDQSQRETDTRLRNALIQTFLVAINVVITATLIYAGPLYDKTPYHTSALSGIAWVCELREGHPECICNELGVHKDVFDLLLETLLQVRYNSSRYVLLEEQLAIFLYTSVTGLSIRHVGERFQRSTDTVSRYVVNYIYFYYLLNIW